MAQLPVLLTGRLHADTVENARSLAGHWPVTGRSMSVALPFQITTFM
ncbi:hypothetical protein [Larsenimonas rhizosphaerae]|uniref:Uncharacterized protein n=1 Tax=Larsenimonas rhizosphaerae TaxID=2944682 RepID=A0AA42CUC1_9GAMM|nr:hypothetical protein [Larsenimonas rhizosphaerae]MCX2524527.1 hypothetical protein [Larsenimonas rhizosphaerae]